MPNHIYSDARHLARLLDRPAYITRRRDEFGNVIWRRRLPHEGQPEWEDGEEAIYMIEPDGTEKNLKKHD